MNNFDIIEIDESNDSTVELNQDNNNDLFSSDDDDDFEIQKKSKIPRLDDNDLESSKKQKEVDERDEEFCPICLDHWTSAGAHRLVCLKCGHLFGESCIEKWLSSNQKCPQCNHPNKTRDIRRIYAKSFKVLDNTELTEALKNVESERSLRKHAEINRQEAKLQYQQLNEKYGLLKEELERYKQAIKQPNNMMLLSSTNATTSTDRSNMSAGYLADKTINITDITGCRVVQFSQRYLNILVSQPSSLSIFPGFGIKKINFLDYKPLQYIPVHSKSIRDMAINTSNDDGIVLTCGMDKQLKLTNINTCSNIHSFTCPNQIWSVAYNLDNPLYFYAGLANGQTYIFDKRKIDKQVEELNSSPENITPAASLQFIPKSTSSPFSASGLLVCQFDKVSFYEIQSNGEYKYHPLMMDSSFACCSFSQETRNILVTSRPTQKQPTVRHTVYEMTSDTVLDETNYSLTSIQTYIGASVQKLITKSKLFYYNSKLYGCAPDEPSKSALVWDVNKNETIGKLASSGEIMDVCQMQYNNTSYIATLTDKQLKVFKRSDS